MYSIDYLLHLLHSDGADRLKLRVGKPPVVVIEGEDQALDGAAISIEDAEQFLQSIANTRQRRELREQGRVEFMYKFRGRTSFVVCACIREESVEIDIH